MAELKYSKYLFNGLKDDMMLKFMPDQPQAYFRGDWQIPGVNINMGWQVIKSPAYMERAPHKHDVDEYFAILGADPKDMFGSFDAEIDLMLGPEKEMYTITEPAFVFIPKDFLHCPMEFRIVNKPLLFTAIHLGPRFHKIQGKKEFWWEGPTRSMEGWKGHPDWTKPVDKTKFQLIKKFPKKPGLQTKYAKYIFSGLKDTMPVDFIMNPAPYFRGDWQIPGANINIGWQVINKPVHLDRAIHTHDVDEYLVFLGGELPDVFSSFSAEIELCMGPEKEKHRITDPTFVFIPKGFPHGPLDIKILNKPMMFQAIHLGPRYQKTMDGREYWYEGPTRSNEGWKGHPEWRK